MNADLNQQIADFNLDKKPKYSIRKGDSHYIDDAKSDTSYMSSQISLIGGTTSNFSSAMKAPFLNNLQNQSMISETKMHDTSSSMS